MKHYMKASEWIKARVAEENSLLCAKLREYEVTLACTRVASRPDDFYQDEPGAIQHDHWHYLLESENPVSGQREHMTGYFSKGPGLRVYEPGMPDAVPMVPALCEVMESLFSDASTFSDYGTGDFESWCSDLWYNSDSLKACRIYRECERIFHDLERLFGDLYPLYEACQEEGSHDQSN